jgi:hypothetical protein
MDKYYDILLIYNNDLSDFLEDHDISPADVLVALDSAGVIDCDEIHARMYYGIEEEPDS